MPQRERLQTTTNILIVSMHNMVGVKNSTHIMEEKSESQKFFDSGPFISHGAAFTT